MILASQSPRRQQLLEEAGYTLTIKPANIDETAKPHEDPRALVVRLATQKARHCEELLLATAADTPAHACPEPILAADTVVWTQDAHILGKPHSKAEAAAMLRELSGTKHYVSSGVAIIADGVLHTLCETCTVYFYPLTESQIAQYVASTEPYDKAGAYGIQGHARLFIEKIDGDFYTVMGLPIARCVQLLSKLGYPAILKMHV